MDKATMKKILDEMNKQHSGTSFTEAQVRKMKPIAKLNGGDSDYTVYAMQQGDVTILAWVTRFGNVWVKTQPW